uniref:Uncharacterized protein n=1 Tax=Aegilops tauschii TaxID=37682 RepID=R7WCU5_AEGTA
MEQMFDTIGWFARDLAILSRVTDVLLPPVPADAFDGQLRRPSRVIIPADCFKILGSVEEPTYKILNASVAKVFGNDAVVNNGNIVDFVSSNVLSIGNFMTDLSVVNHTEWVNMVKPNLGPGIRERVQEAIASDHGSDQRGCPGDPYGPWCASEAGHGCSAAGELPGEGLLPAVNRRPVGVLPGQHPAGHPLRYPGVSVATRPAWCRSFLAAVAQELQEGFQDEAATAWGSSS